MESPVNLSVIGLRLRAAREGRGLTLDQLSALSGISKTHLSRLESSERQPSVATLLELAGVLDVLVSTLLGEDADGARLTLHRQDEPRHDTGGLEIASASGYAGSHALEALRVTVKPGRKASPPTQHRGEEWLYVLEGVLQLEYDGSLHELTPGTSAHFDASRPHRMTAESAPAEVLLVAADEPTRLSHAHR